MKINRTVPFILILFAVSVSAHENSDCFMCHADKTLSKKRDGKTISLYVNENELTATVHGGLACTSCHSDLVGKELPHEENLAPAAGCGTCHAKEQNEFADSLHGKALAKGDKLAPRCQNCHGSHNILPVKNPKSSVSPMKIPLYVEHAIAKGLLCRNSVKFISPTFWRTIQKVSMEKDF